MKENLMIKTTFLIFFFYFNISGCTEKKYSSDQCSQLSFKSFKGSPKALSELNQNCSLIKYKYTKEYCQKILTQFILTGNQKNIISLFGELAPHCLTNKDIQRFSLKQKN